PLLEDYRDRVRIMHQTGKPDFEKVQSGYRKHGWLGKADVREYIEDMVTEFAKANLVVSRAGATTSAELMAAGRPAIMVPLPGQLEQRRNAEAMQERGAARILLQEELTPEKLAGEIKSLLGFPERLIEMAGAARSMARRNAAVAVVNMIENLIQEARQ
ncbi:MAG: UDP-N-acetylglucosamine--N-acetylmuramyl-(pentapeptide) pyrophosphoryl-undecaprenol N-acetylglucosamine transferase, partial [Pyrinomonadaceae bacterium]